MPKNRNKGLSQPSTQKKEYDFGGPVNVFFMMLSLPLTIYAFYFVCNERGCLLLDNFSDFSYILASIPSLSDFFSLEAFIVYTSWFGFQSLLYVVLPGAVVKGVVLEDGSRLPYRTNAFAAYITTFAFLGFLHWRQLLDLSYLYDQFLPLATSAIIFALLLSIYLYVSSLSRRKGFSKGGNTGNTVYDFFVGRELNPRLGAMFDLKYFCELRPGLFLWVLLNFSMAIKQYQLHGYVSNSMVLVCVFHFVYVLDAVWSEAAILTTMDIITEGFGFMLAFGDLAWVPFMYSLQSRFLVAHPVHLSVVWLVIIIATMACGFYIFRGANGEKNAFRQGELNNGKYLQTSSGRRLLVSGWWAKARHINYLGDMLMALSWCLPCQFLSVVPYFYFVYLTILLVHRQIRDDHHCAKKYGQDWKKYCQIVPYRIIPKIY